MTFDPLVANPGRLQILAALATEPVQEFVRLRASTQLTDGNLATHARRLQSAGLVGIEKSTRAGRPVTTFNLTETGRAALTRHARRIMDALVGTSSEVSAEQSHVATSSTAVLDEPGTDQITDDWID